MKIFTEAEVDALLPMHSALAAVQTSLRSQARGAAVNHARRRLVVPRGAMLHAMEAAVEIDGRWYIGFKIYSTSRQGARFLVGLYDGDSGVPLALFEADRLGQRRTGAASGLATRLLASPDAAIAGIIGAGWQAESQLEAIALVRPLRLARVFSPTPAHRQRFAATLAHRLGFEVQPAASAAAAVEGAAIVVAATNARDPVVPEAALAPDVHINAIGSNSPQRRELDATTVLHCDRIVVDSLAQCLEEAGDLRTALATDSGWQKVEELASAIERGRGRQASDRRTLFKSTGLALWDVACAAHVWRQAQAH